MLLTLFNIFLSIIELCQLVLVVNQELFRIVKRMLIAPERKSVKNETVVVTGKASSSRAIQTSLSTLTHFG